MTIARDLEAAIAKATTFNSEKEKERVFKGLRWIGVFSDEQITPAGTPIDILCAVLEKKMQYQPGERDMVMLQHRFEIENKDGSKETRTSTLVDYGDPDGYSAMAKLVGITGGIACKMVLDGSISERGLLAPLTPALNDPLMAELRKHGIWLTEKTV